MSEEVRVLQLKDYEYAAEVHEAGQTTEHRVTFVQDTLDDLMIGAPDEHDLVVESVRYLLQDTPSTSLPHDIDLAQLQTNDANFIPEMRSRLGS